MGGVKSEGTLSHHGHGLGDNASSHFRRESVRCARSVMADGSVRQVSAGIDPRVFKAMCTIRGAESVDLQQAGSAFDLQELKPQ